MRQGNPSITFPRNIGGGGLDVLVKDCRIDARLDTNQQKSAEVFIVWETVEELEGRVGAQVRSRRLSANRTAEDVAAEAGIAARTLQNLERGRGSSVSTLIKVLRALDAESWLETLTPDEPVSPIAVLEAARRRPGRQRASRSDG